MARRRGESGVVERFEEAIRLADLLGDVEAQIESLLNLATARVDAGEFVDADTSLTTAQRLVAETEGQSEFAGRMTLIRANIAFAREEFDASYELYLRAMEESKGEMQVHSMAAALLVLARMRRRVHYRRFLGRVVREGQRMGMDGVTGIALLPSAKEWAEVDAAGLSARTYADAIELALAEWMHALPVGIDRSNAETEVSQASLVGEGRMDSLVYVIARMSADLANVPSVHAKVDRQIMSRLKRELPDPISDLVGELIHQSDSVLAESNGPFLGTQ
jgi:hypothetical protein